MNYQLSNKMDQELKDSILKTGTTILGIVCKDGVVMASDLQATKGHVASGKFSKTNKINEYSMMSFAGNASDAQRLLKIIAAELKLKELRSKSRPTVNQAANLTASISFSNIRQPSMIPSIVGSIIGGFNEDGTTEIYSIGPDGTISNIDSYDASGSGDNFVIGFLERQYKKDITIKEGVELAKEALKSSTQRDIYSGLGIDVFTITKDGIKKVVSQEILPDYKDDENK
ncbi:MAG: proteasome subunit beta [Nanoarchaeota archaeon]|nr:proteasome subunit beta [Nanoarchaeota archaeon]